MDYVIQLIGVLLIVNGGSTPGVQRTMALVPPAPTHAFCSNTISVAPHTLFLRVPAASVDARATQWPAGSEQRPCDPGQNCTLFKISDASDIAIDSGFEPIGSGNPAGATFCQVPRLGELKGPNIQLVRNPISAAFASVALPAGTLESLRLRNGVIGTVVKVKAPANAPSKAIRITATPRNGKAKRVLVVAAGTTIDVMNMEDADAGADLNASRPMASHDNHFFLVNGLLAPKDEICEAPRQVRPNCANQPIATGVGLYINCSNTGCCP